MNENRDDREDRDEGLIYLALDENYTAPKFTAERSKDWVPYLTPEKTQYPDMLMDLYNNSAVHGSIVSSKAEQMAVMALC
jgi:hypothetical protein